MAGDWIKMRVDLDADPVVVALAARHHVSECAIVGCLWKLWAIANQQTRDGHLKGYTPAILDGKCGLPGFAKSLARLGWLRIRLGCLQIPRFELHNGESAKARSLNTARQKARRASVAQDARPEKRREEKRREINTTPPTPLKEGGKEISSPRRRRRQRETVEEAIARKRREKEGQECRNGSTTGPPATAGPSESTPTPN